MHVVDSGDASERTLLLNHTLSPIPHPPPLVALALATILATYPCSYFGQPASQPACFQRPSIHPSIYPSNYMPSLNLSAPTQL